VTITAWWAGQILDDVQERAGTMCKENKWDEMPPEMYPFCTSNPCTLAPEPCHAIPQTLLCYVLHPTTLTMLYPATYYAISITLLR
jgi:hypothetical protein